MDAAKTNQVALTGCIIGWIILLSANPSRIAVVAQNLTANATLENNDTVTACPGETVVFTCQTMGPLAWRSDEYIGEGGNQIIFGPDDREGNRQNIDIGIYIDLVSIENGIINSTFHIEASLSSCVTCTATNYDQSSQIYLRVPDKSGVPEDPVAIQIRDTRYKTCFILVVWKNSANSVEDQVTHYTININQYFMSNQTANLSSDAYYSLFLPTECSENHTVDISATNVCGVTGLSTIYRTQSQGGQCPTDTDTSNCDITDETPTKSTLTQTTTVTPMTVLTPTTRGRGYSEQNCGNILLMIACCSVVTMATYLLGSFKTLLNS